MPKREIQAADFITKHPQFDGRGVTVAILDTGVDIGAAGLQITSDGKPKVIDCVDCTGAGDVDMRTKVKATDDHQITSVSGKILKVNSLWTNPTGEWRVGAKLLYSLLPRPLVTRLKEEKKRQWEEANRVALALASQPESSTSSLPAPSGSTKQKAAELEARVSLLKDAEKAREDPGPIIEVCSWHDGKVWRVALDTTELEQLVKGSRLSQGSDSDGSLSTFKEPLTDFKTERKYATFSTLDSCNYCVNVYEGGDVVSIVVDAGAHGTHVAGIVGANFQNDPGMNGIAPGCQIISLKIGDTRLGSMETGTALTRAFIAAKAAKVDLINMSYGEPTSTPNAGRIVELANQLVDEHGIIFVASAGNSGPALSTVGAPGGTSSSILGIGAYVSPQLAEAGHSVRPLPLNDDGGGGLGGTQYTWSSRGPTADGDLGVNFSAPGGAISPVPSWCLSMRQLMNGTSMASPNACGGIALLLSGLKQKNLHGCQLSSPSPSSLSTIIRRAIEATCLPLGQGLEDSALTYGRGLLQVNQAFEYLEKSHESLVDKLAISYTVTVNAAGGGPSMRGIYLRQAQESARPSSFSVTVTPSIHSSSPNDERLEIEDRIVIEATEPWISCPASLLLHNASRSFEIKIDPGLAQKAPSGLSYGEVRGYDSSAQWRGPLFSIPVTLICPLSVPPPPLLPEIELGSISFENGSEMRRFIDVPLGASWAEISIKSGAFDTPKTFLLRATQLQPHFKKNESTKTLTLSPNSTFVWNIGLVPGSTLEITLAQFWSSLGQSHLSSISVSFHGLVVDGLNPSGSESGVLAIDPSLGPKRLLVKAPLRDEQVKPELKLEAVSFTLRPEPTLPPAKPQPLSQSRDGLWDSRLIYSLSLLYKLTAVEGGKYTFTHAFNGHVYDGEFEGQMLAVYESDGKKLVSTSDIYPETFTLKKGSEYSLRLMLRHDKRDLLSSLSNLPLVVKRKLESPISLPVYPKKNSAVLSTSAIADTFTVKSAGIGTPIFIGSLPDDKEKSLPKDCVTSGRVLHGKLSLGQVSSGTCPDKANISVAFPVPPPKPAALSPADDPPPVSAADADGSRKDKDEAQVSLDEMLRDSKIKHLKDLKITAPFFMEPGDLNAAETKPTDRIYRAIFNELSSAYPKHLPLLTEHMKKIDSLEKKLQRSPKGLESIIAAADLVIDAVDPVKVQVQLGVKSPLETAEGKKAKKEAEEGQKALIEAWSVKARALLDWEELELDGQAEKVTRTDEAFHNLRQWVDTSAEAQHALLHARIEARSQRLGLALQTLEKALASDDSSVKSGAEEIKAFKLKLIKKLGWKHIEADEEAARVGKVIAGYNFTSPF